MNNNGAISFSRSVDTFTPDTFPLRPGTQELIAPYWSDVDTRPPERAGGTVWYRETADPSVLSRARSEISRGFADHQDFNPVYALIATWDHVGYYDRKFDKASDVDKIASRNFSVIASFPGAQLLSAWERG